MSQWGRHGTMLDRRKLVDRARSERCQVADRALERGEGRSRRLVGDRDSHLRSCGERFDQRPFRAGQILEAVGEDRLPLPCREIALNPLGGTAAQAVPVPETEPVELGAIRTGETSELAADSVEDRSEPTRARLLRTAAPRRTRSSSTKPRANRGRCPRQRAAQRVPAAHRWRRRAVRDLRRRSARRGRRTCRSDPRAARDVAGGDRARRARRRRGWARRATDRVRGPRDSARGARRPCRHAPARRRARDPSAHGNPGPRPSFVRSWPF